MALAAAREDKPTVAVILMFLAVFLFTLIDSSAKWLILYGLPAVQVIFARYCGAFLVLILLFIPRGGLNQFVSNNPKLQYNRPQASPSVFLYTNMKRTKNRTVKRFLKILIK